MARFITDLQSSKPVEQALAAAEQYLGAEGFTKVTYGGETVWKKGLGLMLGPQFVKLEPGNNGLHMEAWIKFALLPGVYVAEMGIDGVFGIIPKRKLKERVDRIVAIVR